MIVFENLSSVKFEEFCCDLLKEMGFINVDWRKRTGLNSSPSDQGRDIVANFVITDPDGEIKMEKWFIECKHYEKGVPPDKISSAITWADAERPDVLLIIASNFLSNPTKEYLEKYNNNNKPTFRIKTWENPTLENLVASKYLLLKNYGIPTTRTNIDIFNPNHIVYMSSKQVNSIPYFLNMMDILEPKKRDDAFQMTYMEIIHNNFRNDPGFVYDYSFFRKRCLSIYYAPMEGTTSYVHRIVGSALSGMFFAGNKLELPNVIKRNEQKLERLRIQLLESANKPVISTEIQRIEKHINNLPHQTDYYWDVYNYICDELLPKLLMEYNVE